MKYSKTKQLVGYIYARCIVLAPSLPLLTAFAIQSLLVVFLCWLANREEVLGNTAVLSSSSGPYGSIWVGEAEGITDFS